MRSEAQLPRRLFFPRERARQYSGARAVRFRVAAPRCAYFEGEPPTPLLPPAPSGGVHALEVRIDKLLGCVLRVGKAPTRSRPRREFILPCFGGARPTLAASGGRCISDRPGLPFDLAPRETKHAPLSTTTATAAVRCAQH